MVILSMHECHAKFMKLAWLASDFAKTEEIQVYKGGSVKCVEVLTI